MTDQDIKKLAEWAGFCSKVVTRKSADFNGIYLDQDGKFKKPPDTYEKVLWHNPAIQDTMLRDYWYAENGLPNFTKSLDACLKWLTPEVHRQTRNSIDIRLRRKDAYCEFASEGGRSCHATAETPALALCQAILKLVGKEG